jgi:hypothetical protein
MPVPATTGQLRTRIEDMEIGDYIKINSRSGGTPSLGDGGLAEFPVNGLANGSGWQGWNYYVKVDKGLMVSDRVIMHSVSWDTINSWRNMQGITITIDGVEGKYRCLTGGVAYAGANGSRSDTDQGYGGWPTINEWDKYIVNFPTDKIQVGKTLDDVFHHGVYTMTQDTNIIGANVRTVRGQSANVKAMTSYGTTTGGTYMGFRPVFEYKEV